MSSLNHHVGWIDQSQSFKHLFATAMEDSGHLGADNDDAMMVEEDSGPVEDAGEWPVVEFI